MVDDFDEPDIDVPSRKALGPEKALGRRLPQLFEGGGNVPPFCEGLDALGLGGAGFLGFRTSLLLLRSPLAMS